MRPLRIALISLLVFTFHAQGQTLYRNRNYGFTVIQPKGWTRYEGFDRNGVEFSPRGSGPNGPEIHVGWAVNQPSETTHGSSQTADEIVNAMPETLQEYAHAQDYRFSERSTLFLPEWMQG